MEDLFVEYRMNLKDLLRYGLLKAEILENPSLYNGKLGLAIIFYEYSRYSRDLLYRQFADELIDSIIELPNDISMRLSDGLCGIGWGICYLLRKKFIVGDVDKILFYLDEIISNTSVSTEDKSIYLKYRKSCLSEFSKTIYNEENKILSRIWKTNLCE